MSITKQCTKCGFIGDESSFYRNSNGKDNLTTRCATCLKQELLERRKQNKAKNPEKYRRTSKNTELKRNYGIDIAQYEEMMKNQEFMCLICKTHQSEVPRSFAVDHNHSTGAIRGLLCGDCNRALGLFKVIRIK